MSVDIEAVLALLPEMFPGVQEIPLKNIRPNPENPGPALSDQDIRDMADNLAERGLVNPIKVQPDRARPLAGDATLHSDNPRLRGDGRPWTVGDFNYSILAGERRYRAAALLKWETIRGFILNPTMGEAVEITHLDNDIRDRGWWATYQSLEQRVKANPELTQGQVALKLKMNRPRVNRALSLLPLLNPEARGLISTNCTNSNKGIRGISESVALRLADLGPSSTLKPGVRKEGDESQNLWPYPPIPTETQDLVRRTLEAAIDRGMTEAQVKALVDWIKAGNQPEDFNYQKKPVPANHSVFRPSPSSPEGVEGSSRPQGEKEGVSEASTQVTPSHHQTGKGISADSPMESAPGNRGPQHVASGHGLPPMNKGQERLLKFLLESVQWVIKAIGAVLKAIFWTPFKGAVKDLAKPAEDFMRFVWFWVIVLALLWAAYDRIFHPGDLTARFKSLMPAVSAKADTGGGASVSRSQTETHDLSVPISKSEIGTAVTQANPSLNKPSSPAKSANDGLSLQSLSNRRSPEVPEELNNRMKDDAEDDAELAKTFFEKSYHNEYEDWQYYFDRKLSEEYCKVFYQKYLTPEKQQDLKDEKIYMTFEPAKPPKLLKFDDFSDDFLVQGVLTTRSDLNYPKKLISRKKVGLIVETYHNSDGSEAVVKVTEVK